jgi:hypothetical protein
MSSNNYPFLTKAQIKDRIAEDDAFVVECLQVMHNRQTTEEQDTKTTKSRNKRGWMSSHAVRGTELALKVIGGETLTEEELAKVRTMVSSYPKQLAQHFRQAKLAETPELKETAAVFGVADC